MLAPLPRDLGLPDRFREWRPNQIRAIEDILASDKRFIGQMQRAGLGKTLTYMAVAMALKARTCIVTSTKGLQSQLIKDFESIGLVDMRGKANYRCMGNPGHNCEEGTIGKCIFKGSDQCTWNNARQTAMQRPLVTTNYPCWIASNKYGIGLGAFDLLILDEFHNCHSALSSAMRVQISDQEVTSLLKWDWPDLDDVSDMAEWKKWAKVTKARIDTMIQEYKDKLARSDRPSNKLVDDFKKFKALSSKLADIASCRASDWVAQKWEYGFKFDPIHLSEFGERVLFCGIPKVVLSSGTMHPMSLVECGIGEEEFDFFEYFGNVQISKSPLIHIPTAYVTRDSTKGDLLKIVRRVDQIIELRSFWRGIIHTHTHKLRDFIIEYSKYSKYMISNYSRNGDVTAEVVERFKASDPPAILVSASVSTGYDFPDEAARYQIIIKLPYPNHHISKVEMERDKLDPKRGIRQMWETLSQSFSRPLRSEDDYSECYILDNCVQKAMLLHGDLAPVWLPAHYRVMHEVPAVPLV